jgi:hypothetical protein
VLGICWQFAILLGSLLLSHVEEQLEEMAPQHLAMAPQHLAMMLVNLATMHVRVICCWWFASLRACLLLPLLF